MNLVLNRQDAGRNATVDQVMNVSAGEIEIYDIIAPAKMDESDPVVTADDVVNALDELDGDVTLRINSRGGEVGTALTIYNRLKAYDKGEITAVVDGYAFSSAGWIPMAADNREISTGGIFMLHNPRMFPMVSSLSDLDSVRNQWQAHHDSIVSIFTDAVAKSSEEITDLMEKETFMSAEEAVNAGFFTKVRGKKANLAALNCVPVPALPEKFVQNITVDASDLMDRKRKLFG